MPSPRAEQELLLLRPRAPAPPHGGVTAIDPAWFVAFADYDSEALLVASESGGELRVRWLNRACADLLCYTESELVGAPLGRLQRSPFAPGPLDAAVDPNELVDGLRTVHRTVSVERRDGSRLRLDVTSVPVGGAMVPAWVLRLSRRPEVAQVAEELQASHERFRALADQAPIGIFSSETGLRLEYVNDRFCSLTGATADQLLGTQWTSRLHPDDLDPTLVALGRVLMGESVELPIRLLRPDGEEREVSARVVPSRGARGEAGFLGILEDVTERRAWERQLAHQALHDPLTGLPNRRQLLEQVGVHLERRRHPLAVMFLDLDDFKLVNDSLGHLAGDRLLVEVAERLLGVVREGDLVARLGGDEFAVLCPGVTDEEEAVPIARRLLEAVCRPVVLDGRECVVGGSLGVVLSSGGAHDRNAEGVLRDADVAMYQAKNGGKGTWALFDEKARQQARDRLDLLADLRWSLDNEQLSVCYQPIIAVEGGDAALVGVEALARWEHPKRGMVPPQEFIRLAEENGLIAGLGRAVLRAACEQMVRWDAELGDQAPHELSVNVSPLQLRQADFAADVAQVLDETGLPGTRLCLELTETVVMRDPEAAIRTFQALRAFGVRIALDDFGTGYSSLALLHKLPVDRLKIDRSFLGGAPRATEDPVVATIVALAASLGLTAVAEGVETEAQLAQLRRLGCPLAQGYLFGRPVSADDLGLQLAGAWMA